MIVSRNNSFIMSTASLVSISKSQFGMRQSIMYIKDRTYLYISVITGNLLVLCFGMAYAWSSPVLRRLMSEEHLSYNPIGRVITAEEASWIGSFLPLGGIFGALIAGSIAAKFGRRSSMVLGCALPFIIAFTIFAYAETVFLFYVARVFAGFGVSGCYTVVPMYLAEISEDSIRGFICCLVMTFETIGELITYSVCPYVSIFWFSVIFLTVTVIVILLIFIFLPESPYYLMSVNNKRGAEKALMKVRACTAEKVRSELEFIESVVEEVDELESSIFGLLRTKAARKAEFITLMLTFIHHFSGVMPVVFYSQSIFKESGSTIHPDYSTMIIGVVDFLSSFVAPNIVDSIGRRWTLFISAFGMFLSEFSLGVYFFMKEKGYDVSPYFWAPVLCLVCYLVFYISGVGPLLWTIMGELFPPHLKSPAFTVGGCIWWALGFIISRSFYPFSLRVGMGITFWIFSGTCLFAMIFSLTCVIETRGKTFQEIQYILEN